LNIRAQCKKVVIDHHSKHATNGFSSSLATNKQTQKYTYMVILYLATSTCPKVGLTGKLLLKHTCRRGGLLDGVDLLVEHRSILAQICRRRRVNTGAIVRISKHRERVHVCAGEKVVEEEDKEET
jgi:hypothetical protein